MVGGLEDACEEDLIFGATVVCEEDLIFGATVACEEDLTSVFVPFTAVLIRSFAMRFDWAMINDRGRKDENEVACGMCNVTQRNGTTYV